jgi:RimJ/RimL family protein N-acetyltransferase
LKAPERLVTERLILRRWRDSDVAPLAKLNADPHVMRFFLQTYDLDWTKERIAAWSEALETRGYGPWAVEVPGLAPCIGFVGAALIRQPTLLAGQMEMAWRLDQPYWGKGFATEAARASLRDVFVRLAPPEIIAYTAAINLPSRRVMEKLGMVEDEAAAFDHPAIEAGHRLRRHVVYRVARQDFIAGEASK